MKKHVIASIKRATIYAGSTFSVAILLLAGSMTLPALLGQASAASYYINDRDGLYINGAGDTPGAEVVMNGPGTVTPTYDWINKGGSDCNGGTCWQIKDNNDGQCLTASETSSHEWLIYEFYCSTGSDQYQLFSSPSSSVYVESLGATKAENNGLKWFWVANPSGSNGYLYVEDNVNRWNTNFTQWYI